MDHCSCNGAKTLKLLKTAKGQTEAIIKMAESDKYCIDISKQVLSVIGLLKKANILILEQHLKTCVKDAFEKGAGDEKIAEITTILDSYLK